MFTAAASVTIERPIDEVFSYLVALDPHLPQWAGGVFDARRTTPGPWGPGTRVEVTGRLMGRPVVSQYVVTTFVPPARFGGTADSSLFGFTELYTLEPRGSATSIRQQTRVQPHGLLRLLEPLMAIAIRRLLASDLARLKSRLETAR